MKKLNHKICLIVWIILVLPMLGCGSSTSQAILPSGELTDEQKAAVKAEDARIEDEESQGKMKKPKSKK
jgi:hypothetical protein